MEVANASLPDSYYKDIHLDQQIRGIIDLLSQRQRRRVFGQAESVDADTGNGQRGDSAARPE
eukprot:12920063-Prorocentrum_lima.AAC.1